MLQAYTGHQQNTQRQGAVLRTFISADEGSYHVKNIERDSSGEIEGFHIFAPLEENTEDLFVKEHPKKPHEITPFIQEQLTGYVQSAYPKIPFKTDSFGKDGTHVLKVQMPAKHLRAWLDVMQILEPFQEQFYAQNKLTSPYAFKINSPDFQFEQGESTLRYKLANLKARITSLLPIVIEWTSQEQWEKLQMLYAHQDFIHDALMPTGFKAIKK